MKEDVFGRVLANRVGQDDTQKLRVLDLFSAAAGGWSLGMHRAGFRTVAACELIDWRRALYAENNPGVRLYDDVRTLTAERLLADLGTLPDVIVGSSPCQGISSANNAKGRGVDDVRSALIFQATRIIGECRPRWFALENSADLRTKGADRVLAELAGHGYTCWPFVVRARDVGANHLRPRAWLIGCDVDHVHATRLGCEGGRTWGRGAHGDGAPSTPPGGEAASDAEGVRRQARAGPESPAGRTNQRDQSPDDVLSDAAKPPEVGSQGFAWRDARRHGAGEGEHAGAVAPGPGASADREGQPHGASHAEVGRGSSAGGASPEPWAEWNGGLAGHLRLDDGLSAWVASTRIALGSPRGSAAAGLLVEAFGDAVLPQIPEAIGRAILRTEAALAAVYEAAA